MAENVTTLPEKWQKQQQDHPEWTPALEDILYVIHGTGSDRDRLYSLEEVRDLLQASISELLIGGNWKLRSGNYGAFLFERIRDGVSDEVLSIGFLDGEMIAANRKVSLNSGVVGPVVGAKRVLDVGSSLHVIANSSDSDGNLVADGTVFAKGGRVTNIDGTPSGTTAYFNLTTDGIVISTGGQNPKQFVVSVDGSNMKMVTGIVEATDFKVSNISAKTRGGKIYLNDDVKVYKTLDVDKLQAKLITSENTILATSDVDLTSSAYSSIEAGTELTIVNDSNSTVTVTFASGNTEVVAVGYARRYIKGNSGWKRLAAYDPTSQH